MTGFQELLARDFATLSDAIGLHARERGTKPALVQGDSRLTYAELDALMDRVAVALQERGVRKGASIAIVSATTPAVVALFLGALRAGIVPAPIAPSSSPDQVAAMVFDSGASFVFVDAEASAMLPPTVTTVVDLNQLNEWLSPEGTPPAAIGVASNDPFNIIYSSGTTGTPKGIVHTHGMRWTQIVAYATAGFGDAVTMIATPLYSNTTLVSLLPTLGHGGTAVLTGKFDAREFLEVSQRERATHAMLVPVQYQRIMALPDFGRFDLSSYRFKSCTSAPFAADLKADVVRRWPGLLLEVYGMTEGGGTCLLYANLHPDKLHTVGQPAPGSDIRLIDDQGREVPRGGIGEVVGRSGVMMAGYHGRPDVTSAAEWRDADGNVYIRHGDLGRFDEDGFLTLLGRTKDMIISGGFNVYPPDIETVLLEHPGITDAAVIGVPSDAWGETPHAFVVMRDGSVDPADVVAWVNARVGKTQRLSSAEVLGELPRSAIGKILKRELRDLYLAARAA